MATKRENGLDFPASAYLVAPDGESPSTWKLRIWEDPDKKVTKAQLGRAAAALGPGFRGRKVELSADQRQTALRKLRRLYRSAGVEAASLPAVLKEAMHTDAMRRAARMMANEKHKKAAMSRAMQEEASEDEPQDIVADLAEAYMSMDSMSAMQDGEMSYESCMAAVSTALADRRKAKTLPEQGSDEWENPSLRATFPGACVYEYKSKMYQCSYRMGGSSATMENDDIEVIADFVPAPAHLSETQDIWEPRRASGTTVLAEAKIDKRDGVLRDVVFLTSQSVNGAGGGGREYTENALRQVAQLSEGLPSYANHVKDKADAFKPRDVRDLIGVHRNVRFDPTRQRIMSDLHVAEHHQPWVFSLAESMPNAVGLSPVARALVRPVGNKEIVEEVIAVRSGDLVTDPAATKGLFEHREEWWREPNPSTKEGSMGLKELMEAIQKLTDIEREALIKQIAGPTLAERDKETSSLTEAKGKIETELATTKTELATAKQTLTAAQTKIDGYLAAEALQAKRGKVQEAIEASDLGKKYSKVEGAVSELFRQTLLEADETKWSGMIADRVAVLAKASGGGSKSTGKESVVTEGREPAIPAGAHARLASALQ